MSVARRREDSSERIDAALQSCERVKQQAKKVSEALSDRKQRAHTEPFEKLDFVDEEDSLVTSIETVIATAQKKEE